MAADMHFAQTRSEPGNLSIFVGNTSLQTFHETQSNGYWMQPFPSKQLNTGTLINTLYFLGIKNVLPQVKSDTKACQQPAAFSPRSGGSSQLYADMLDLEPAKRRDYPDDAPIGV